MRMGGLSITRRCEDDPWTPAPDATAGGFFAASANLQLQISSLPLPAPARDFQPDPPVYNLSNRIRFGRQMSAERALCGMRIDQRGAVARKSPARAGWLGIVRGRGVASTPSCVTNGARRRPSAELAVGSRPPGAPSTTRIVKGIGGLTIDVDGASLSIRDPTWRNSTLPTSFSAVSF